MAAANQIHPISPITRRNEAREAGVSPDANSAARPPQGESWLYSPDGGRLRTVNRGSRRDLGAKLEHEIGAFIGQPNYPCLAALKSYRDDDYQVGVYGTLGSGRCWKELRRDLEAFLALQKKTNSTYLSFWAVFPDDADMNDGEFEAAMWKELSFLTSVEDRERDWRAGSNSNPNDKDFSFSLFGEEFFVVGLQPNSSRRGRQFRYPAILFNVMSQFDAMIADGIYESMVKANRAREMKFQGSLNPMVETYGDEWETIQFSGRRNSSSWGCPFHFLWKSEKP